MNRPRPLAWRIFGGVAVEEVPLAPLPDDLVRWVSAHFSADERDAALACLRQGVSHSGEPASPRFLRCAALASGGELLRLQQFVAQLRTDWRSVIMAGEYSKRDKRIYRTRDLGKPIVEI